MAEAEFPLADLDCEKSWVDLTDHQRRLIKQHDSLLAELPTDGLPASTTIAIVSNAAIAAQGTWQYSTDRKTAWTDIPTNLSDTRALILPTRAALRFKRAPNWSGTPGALAARFYYGDIELPLSDARDISEWVGVPGQWTAGIVSIDVDAGGNLVWSGALWDFLATGAADLAERRREVAREWGEEHNPALDQHAAARVRDAAFKLEVTEETPSTSHSDELAKQTLLDRYRNELAQAEADLEKSLALKRGADGTSFGVSTPRSIALKTAPASNADHFGPDATLQRQFDNELRRCARSRKQVRNGYRDYMIQWARTELDVSPDDAEALWNNRYNKSHRAGRYNLEDDKALWESCYGKSHPAGRSKKARD